jgi:hypothetical protein
MANPRYPLHNIRKTVNGVWQQIHETGETVTVPGSTQAEYDSFPDQGETHDICQAYVPMALQWCIDCISAHKTAIINIQKSTTIEELNQAKIINYPDWIF